MNRRIFAAVAAVVLFVSAGAPAAQAASYMECAACQLVLGLVESSAGDGSDVVVDASRQCSLLPAADRDACVTFYAAMGPKFIKALKDRRAKGENLEGVCRSMDYCQ